MTEKKKFKLSITILIIIAIILIDQVSKILVINFVKQDIGIITLSKKIEEIKIVHKTYSGEHFRALLNLKSSDVTLIINPTFLRCITKGWGNQYGLSQFGANEIAKNGGNYLSIIKYYFKDVSIKKYK